MFYVNSETLLLSMLAGGGEKLGVGLDFVLALKEALILQDYPALIVRQNCNKMIQKTASEIRSSREIRSSDSVQARPKTR